MHRRYLPLFALALIGSGCASQAPRTASLSGTSWQLIEIQSMDDTVTRPQSPGRYTLTFGADGTANLRLDCNRANGTYTAKPSSAGQTGELRFGPLAMTRMMCAPGSLDSRMGRDLDFVRSYMFKDGRLYLSLMADGGIYAWEPARE